MLSAADLCVKPGEKIAELANYVRKLHRCYVHGGAGFFPLDAESAAFCALVEGNGEIFYWSGSSCYPHVRAQQFGVGSRVWNSPFARFFTNNQFPFVFVGNSEQGVVTGGYVLSADHEVRGGHKGGGFIRSSAPGFAVRDDAAEYLK